MSNDSPFGQFGRVLRADPPQRYLGNHSRYLARGGKLRLGDDLRGFLAGDANHGDMARFYFFSLAFDQIVKEGLTGNLAELGVYKGNTSTLLASYARRLGVTAYILDTFEGFSQKDLKDIDADKRLDFDDTSLESVRALVGEDNATFVKGFFPDTAAQLPENGTYCLVHIDCDLYAPITSALEYFYPRMVPGGFLIVHDYTSLAWNGAEKAVDEFFLDKPECPSPLPDGAGSVVIRKARPLVRGANWLDRKRRALLSLEWASAADGNLSDLLGEGWSGAEPWGVWGVGAKHILHVAPPADLRHELTLELDVAAAVTPMRGEQIIDVSVRGQPVDSWEFTLESKRSVRTLRVSADIESDGQPNDASFEIEFRPRSVRPVSEITPGSSDIRSLGLGLHQLRMSSI
jgi:hypothetical protein